MESTQIYFERYTTSFNPNFHISHLLQLPGIKSWTDLLYPQLYQEIYFVIIITIFFKSEYFTKGKIYIYICDPQNLIFLGPTCFFEGIPIFFWLPKKKWNLSPTQLFLNPLQKKLRPPKKNFLNPPPPKKNLLHPLKKICGPPKKERKKNIVCISATIGISQEIQCLLYARFLFIHLTRIQPITLCFWHQHLATY